MKMNFFFNRNPDRTPCLRRQGPEINFFALVSLASNGSDLYVHSFPPTLNSGSALSCFPPIILFPNDPSEWQVPPLLNPMRSLSLVLPRMLLWIWSRCSLV